MIFKEDDPRIEQYPKMVQFTNFLKPMERNLIGREKELHSLMAAMMRPELCNVILLGDAGSGKALDDNTPIPVADQRGYVPIGDIKEGDFVYDLDGKPTKVLGVYHQGVMDAYKVSFSDGSEIVCNDMHIWSVKDGYTDSGEYADYTLRELMERGIYAIETYMEEDGEKKQRILFHWDIPVANAIHRPEIFLLVDPKEYGASIDFRDPNARIDATYFMGSEAQRQDLLLGLASICGVKQNYCQYKTASLGLVNDIVELTTSLGIRPAWSPYGTDSDGHEVYEISFSLVQYDDSLSITDVVKLEEPCAMTCIYVEAEDHLYIAGKQHIVTHNTALVQGAMKHDKSRAYLEVDLPKMIAASSKENEIADMLKSLFREVEIFRRTENKEIVLFIDEFHQIVQLSAAAVEVMKPLLADSGTRGIRVIAATTYKEFDEYVAPNQPLVERLQRINLTEPGQNVVVAILRDAATRYGVADQFRTDQMFEAIYEYTNRYIPANAQPRKSLLMLDSMIGWHRYSKIPMDMKMLANVIYDTEGINVAFRVDAASIKKTLDDNVIAQKYATTAIEQRLQICCADLNNKEKPMSSFLFVGSTGVGKRLSDDTMIPVYSEYGVYWKRNGDLEVGDKVFNREGKPVTVTKVFHFKDCEMLEVELTDGRKILADPEHLWQYKSRCGSGAKRWKVADTQTLMVKINDKYYGPGRSTANVKFVIPMNQPVQWNERQYALHPYVLGVAIGNGCLTESMFTISSNDEACVHRCAELIGAVDHTKNPKSYSWCFHTGAVLPNGNRACHQTKDILKEVPELINKKSGEKFIPEIYKTGSIEQRWELIRGLFDTDGHIGASSSRYSVSYSTSSEILAYDVQHVLYSLGVSSSVRCYQRDGKSPEYRVHVKTGNKDKHKFFWLPRKKDKAFKAAEVDADKTRIKSFDEVVGIRDIRKTNIRCDATCIMVDDEEHLYQAGDFIVTHNTETAKQLSKILFDNDRSLIRMDMSEYALDESIDRFREEITQAVWTRPYSIILLDEIEKACAPVTKLLLQVLDDGRLIDRHNREVTFKNSYIIITTNAGSEIFKTIAQYAADDSGSGKLIASYETLIRKAIVEDTGGVKFPPELLGRIDCLVPFQPLSERTMEQICQIKLTALKNLVKQKHHCDVFISNDIYKYIIQDKMTTDSDAGGARAVVSRIEREVTTAIAKYLNEHRGVPRIYVNVCGDLAIENKTQLESKAYILITDRELTDQEIQATKTFRTGV